MHDKGLYVCMHVCICMFYRFLLAQMSVVKDSLQHSQNSPYKFLMYVPLHCWPVLG